MLKKIYCRCFQAILKIGNYFMGYRTPETLQGAGCILELPKAIKATAVDKVLIVSGPHISKSEMMQKFLEAMDKAGVAYSLFSDLQSNPTDDNVEAGLAVMKANSCKGIVAFGGGSPMDCAKAIAARYARPRKTVAQLQGLLKVMRRIVPFWAVPTTSGTGSETTVAAVITEARTGHKASINDTALLPKYAVLDPELTVGLSPHTTAATGMDALCHAVEAYTNWTYCTGTEKKMAKDAVKLIYENLYKCYQDGTDIEARQNMQMAAFYAGRAFTRGCVGYVHACGHPLSAKYGLHHGLVMAAILPLMMRAYKEAAHRRLAELADVCAMPGNNDAEKAEAFISWIEELNNKMGIPAGFPEIKEEDIPTMSRWADQEANPLYPVPVIWNQKEFADFYRKLKINSR